MKIIQILQKENKRLNKHKGYLHFHQKSVKLRNFKRPFCKVWVTASSLWILTEEENTLHSRECMLRCFWKHKTTISGYPKLHSLHLRDFLVTISSRSKEESNDFKSSENMKLWFNVGFCILGSLEVICNSIPFNFYRKLRGTAISNLSTQR